MTESKSQRFYDWVSDLTKLAQQHYRARNIPSLLNVMKRFRSLFNDNQKDPELAWLETATTNCLLMLAEAYLDELEFDDCFELCEEARALLETKRSRSLASNQTPQPDSLAWMRLVYILADVKWKCPEQYKYAAIPPDEMIATCLTVRAAILSGLKSNPRSANEEVSIRKSLALTLTKTACIAMRYVASMTKELTNLLAHDAETSALSANSQYYWSLRITELSLQDDSTANELDQAYSRFRELAVSEASNEIDLTAFEKAIVKEKEYVIACFASPRVISFPKNTSRQS